MNFHSPTDATFTAPSRSSRRVIGGLVLGGLAALAGLGPVTAKPKRQPQAQRRPEAEARRRPNRRRQRRPRYKIVTRTFASTGPITIPETGPVTPYPATIQVGGLRAGTILDVNVTLRALSYRFPTDLDVVVVAPEGRSGVGLMSEVGGTDEVTNVTLTFDDQAAGWLPFEQQIVSGTFKPTLPGAAPRPETASLRTFNGLNPNGTWRLYVVRDGAMAGSIDGWTLTIKARVRV